MPDERRYTEEQISTAARELYEATGSEEELAAPGKPDQELSTAGEAIHRLREEIRLLRERGFADVHIADLLNGFDVNVTAEELTRYAPARN